MKLVHVVGNGRRGISCWMRALQIPGSLPDDGAPPRHGKLRGVDDRYRVTWLRTSVRRAAGALPPVWRERVAEWFLRRAGAPGPAAEHVLQYLLSAATSKRKIRTFQQATVAKGADTFYERQYRQYLNPVMGAFAMTATQVLLASGGASRSLLWRHCRKTYAAMLEWRAGAPPIMVIDPQTVAVPLLLPKPANGHERAAVGRWLGSRGAMPLSYRKLVAGEEVRCVEPHVHARERGADGALLEVMDCVISKQETRLARAASPRSRRHGFAHHFVRSGDARTGASCKRLRPCSERSQPLAAGRIARGPPSSVLRRRHGGGLHSVFAEFLRQAARAEP